MKRISITHLAGTALLLTMLVPGVRSDENAPLRKAVTPTQKQAKPTETYMTHGQMAVLLAKQLSGKKMKPHEAIAYLGKINPPVSPWDGWTSLDRITVVSDIAKCLCEAARIEVKGDKSNPASYLQALQAAGITLAGGGDLAIREVEPIDRGSRKATVTSDPLRREEDTVGPYGAFEEARSFASFSAGVTVGVLEQALQGMLLPGFDGTIPITSIMPADAP